MKSTYDKLWGNGEGEDRGILPLEISLFGEGRPEVPMGIDLMICLDVSSSMMGMKMEIMKDAVFKVISKLRE